MKTVSQDEVPRGETQKSDSIETTKQENTKKINTPEVLRKPKTKKKIICTFYKYGECKNGNKCKNAHEDR